jgi:hypothetical protein
MISDSFFETRIRSKAKGAFSTRRETPNIGFQPARYARRAWWYLAIVLPSALRRACPVTTRG